MVTEGLEHLGQQPRPPRTNAIAAAGYTGNRVAAHLLRVVAGEQSGPRGPATGRVVKLGESQAVFRQSIEIGRLDLPAVATQVGISQIVGQNEDDVRLRPGLVSGAQFDGVNQY